MPYGNLSAIEIDRKLREDFRRRLKEFGILAEVTDPVLAVLFRTFAQEIERLYSETDRIRLSLLDEFVNGLGIEPRMARPAQSVVRFFSGSQSPMVVPAGTELNSTAATGERLTFTTDSSVQVSSARISLAATYQNGQIQLLPGIEMPEDLQSARPSLDPVAARLGPQSAIYLAVENLPASHLSHHSIFFELGPDSTDIQQALQAEPWCIADSNGEFGACGTFRPRLGHAGIRLLEWLVPTQDAPGDAMPEELPELPGGFYAGRVFVFPQVPSSRRSSCMWPKAMEEVLTHIFGREARQVFATPRTWIRITMPLGLRSLHVGLGSVALHAVTVSNVECFNQTIQFDGHGTSIPVSREAGTRKHLVAPLSILGESNSRYLPELELTSDRSAGRYAVRHGRIEIRPATKPDGSSDAHANVRVWVTDGSVGNAVGPGQIAAFAQAGLFNRLRITNPASAAGGTDGESYSSATARFAEALLSRDRVVTESDLVNTVRAFDRRILDASTRPSLMRTSRGLRRVQQIRVALDRNGFDDASVEMDFFTAELTRHLNKRLQLGTELDLAFEWN
jgi:hypothetical protein